MESDEGTRTPDALDKGSQTSVNKASKSKGRASDEAAEEFVVVVRREFAVWRRMD